MEFFLFSCKIDAEKASIKVKGECTVEDSEIIDLLWHRAEGAVDALAAKFGRRLLTTAMNILGDPRDAEEAVNDTYLAIWNAIPPEHPIPLCAYVYKVGKNSALRLFRSRTAQKRNSAYDLSLEELSQVLPAGTLEDQIDSLALGQAIDRFLDTLTPNDRTLFLRRYWFGDSVSQLAVQRFTTANSLSVRLHRIRQRLKDYLNEEGFWI